MAAPNPVAAATGVDSSTPSTPTRGAAFGLASRLGPPPSMTGAGEDSEEELERGAGRSRAPLPAGLRGEGEPAAQSAQSSTAATTTTTAKVEAELAAGLAGLRTTAVEDEAAAPGSGKSAPTKASESKAPAADGKEADEAEEDLAKPVDPKHAALLESRHAVEVVLAETGIDMALYQAVSSFEDCGISPELLKGVYSMGYTKPSKIQERALPLLLGSPPRNLIGQSQSGTGKTAAFSLAMLSRVDFTLARTQAICLAPARELARQIMDVVREMGKYTPVTTEFAIRDSVARGQKITSHVVVGTPGTVVELLKRRQLDPSHVKIYVLDEADSMLDTQGFADQSIRVKNLLPRTCQLVLFSATFPPELAAFAKKFAPNANSISLKQEELSVDAIKQFYMDCKNEAHKVEVLCAIYGLLTIGQSIIFVRRKVDADRLAAKMQAEGHSVTVLHGGQDADQRDSAIDDFREGKSKVLITTNVLARGIDIQQVNLVINYDMPVDQSMRADPETYLHRIGRTGRFGRTGVSINFVHDEASYREMKAIESYFGREIVRVPTEDYEAIESYLKKLVK